MDVGQFPLQKLFSTTTTSLFSHFEKLRINTFINYKNKIGEHWLPRITEELIMIGSQFVYMLTTSLGRHTQ